MQKLGHYAKKFLIGMAIGAGVFGAMTLFGGLGFVTFMAPNPLTNLLYATLFFGAINTSGAIMNALFGDKPAPGAAAKSSPAAVLYDPNEQPERSRPRFLQAALNVSHGSHTEQAERDAESPGR